MNSRELEERFTLPTYNNIRFPIEVRSGRGSYVHDAAGGAYLDLYGGHAVCILGHCHPRWVEDVRRQLGELVFYSNTVYCRQRGEAAELLVRHSYPSMSAVYFCGSGTEANETALKIARKATGRPLVIAMEQGFHGRTIGSLSVTGYPKMRDAFPQNTTQWTRFVAMGDLAAIESIDPSSVASIILEPIQSVAGIRVAPASYYQALRAYCDAHGIVLVFDEVQTGSGRTGRWYSGGHWGVEPDLVTTAKGVAGGIPAGAVIANGRVAATVAAGDQAATFGGGPLAMAGIVSTYRILEEEGIVDQVARLSARVIERLRGMSALGVREVRGLGYLLGIECEQSALDLQKRLLDERVIVGTSSQPHTIRLLPPLTLSDGEWGLFFDAFEKVLRR